MPIARSTRKLNRSVPAAIIGRLFIIAPCVTLRFVFNINTAPIDNGANDGDRSLACLLARSTAAAVATQRSLLIRHAPSTDTYRRMHPYCLAVLGRHTTIWRFILVCWDVGRVTDRLRKTSLRSNNNCQSFTRGYGYRRVNRPSLYWPLRLTCVHVSRPSTAHVCVKKYITTMCLDHIPAWLEWSQYYYKAINYTYDLANYMTGELRIVLYIR